MSVHDITTYINQVKTERYAKDMREALYQALTSLAIDIKTFDAILSDASQETMGRVAEVLQEIYDIKDDLENDIDNIQYAARISALLSDDGLVDTFKGEYVNDGVQHYGMHKYFYISIKKDEEIHFTFTPSQSTAFIIWAYRYDYVDGTRGGNGGVSVYSLSANTPRTLTPTPPDKDVKGLFFYFADCTDYGNGLLELYFDTYYPLSEIISGGGNPDDYEKVKTNISRDTDILTRYPNGPYNGTVEKTQSGTETIEIDISDFSTPLFPIALKINMSPHDDSYITENESLGAVNIYTNNTLVNTYIFNSRGFDRRNDGKRSWVLEDVTVGTNSKIEVEFYSTSNYYTNGATYKVYILKGVVSTGEGVTVKTFTALHPNSDGESGCELEASYYQVGNLVHLRGTVKGLGNEVSTRYALYYPLSNSVGDTGIIPPEQDFSIVTATNLDINSTRRNYLMHIRTGTTEFGPMLIIEPICIFGGPIYEDDRSTTISVYRKEYTDPDISDITTILGGANFPLTTPFSFEVTYKTTDDYSL